MLKGDLIYQAHRRKAEILVGAHTRIVWKIEYLKGSTCYVLLVEHIRVTIR
jgi:hypothetical protein